MEILNSLGGMLGAMLAMVLVFGMAMLPLLMLVFAIWPLIAFGAEPYIETSRLPGGIDRVKRDTATRAIMPREP